MDISHYFKLMAEKDASDMFLSTGAPISIKMEGVLQPMGDASLTAGECKAIAYSLMDSGQIAEFEREKEMNMAISVSYTHLDVYKRQSYAGANTDKQKRPGAGRHGASLDLHSTFAAGTRA